MLLLSGLLLTLKTDELAKAMNLLKDVSQVTDSEVLITNVIHCCYMSWQLPYAG